MLSGPGSSLSRASAQSLLLQHDPEAQRLLSPASKAALQDLLHAEWCPGEQVIWLCIAHHIVTERLMAAEQAGTH